ncbi:MAG: peptide chain release factor N(5)-glutamine methyltransferase [Bacteroidota bacterium]
MSDTAASHKVWTIIDLITWGTSYLSDRHFDDARLNIELLLGRVLNLQRIRLYTNFDTPLSDDELALFKALLKRRLDHEPLQYILGETEFMGLKFRVDKRVLIPRPETEVLVEQTMKEVQARFPDTAAVRVMEIGTGSGCIAISIAHGKQSSHVTAIDSSSEAIDVARENAALNGVSERITFECVQYQENTAIDGTFHCIVSNPPYISETEYSRLPRDVKEYEPSVALADGGDGLKYYRLIAANGKKLLTENGFVIVEHAYDQSGDVQTIFSEQGWREIRAIKDYSGNFRCVFAAK